MTNSNLVNPLEQQANLNLLVISDGLAKSRHWDKSWPPGSSVLSIGQPPEALKFQTEKELSFIDISLFADRARDLVREFVPHFYASLPDKAHEEGKTLAEFVFGPDHHDWWISDLSEKSIFRGRLIERLHALALVKEAVRSYRPSHIWVDVKDGLLAKCIAESYFADSKIQGVEKTRHRRPNYALKALLSRLSVVLEFFFAQLLILALGSVTLKPDASRKLFFFSFFPSWWSNAWSANGELVESFFKKAPDYFKEKDYSVRYAVWLAGKPAFWCKNYRKLRRVLSKQHVVVLQKFCSWRDALKLLHGNLLGIVNRVKRAPAQYFDLDFWGAPIGELVRDELLYTVSNRELYRNVLLRAAVGRLGLGSKDAIIYRNEFQPFERAILQGVNGACATFGFQHSSIGKDYLSHRFTLSEIVEAESDPDSRKFPSYFLCTGKIPAEIMLKDGFHLGKVLVCGAVRYPELRKLIAERRAACRIVTTKELPIILVLVSLNRAEALGLAAVIGRALSSNPRSFHVRLKAHPSNDHSEAVLNALRRMNPKLSVEKLSPNCSLYDAILSAKALVMSGSTVGIEALALGVLPIVFQNHHMYSYTMSSLLEVREAVVIVNNSSELESALIRVLNEEMPYSELRENWPAAVTGMLGGLVGEFPEVSFERTVTEALGA